MQSSIFAKWARGHHLEAYVVLPAAISLLLMAMYFSGNAFLQSIVAPDLKNMPLFSSREFGALEMLQNFFLLCIIFYSLRCSIAAKDAVVKVFALLLIFVSVFVLLEEIDYGAPFIEYITGVHGSLAQETWDRNWHNKTNASGVQNVSYLKLISNFGLLTGFVLAPLLLSSSRNRTLRLLVPSRWMIATAVLIVLLSLLAHYLDDAGHSIIAGNPGNLDKNISEFRELNMYYLFLLYLAILHERIIARQ
ncbi:MAG: hypothetical protein OEU84_11895 [Xanthomonadales bacterium]|jgi:hypothetical protein|nr:hypothetical protein [Xanthomonadales bacterium]MDH4020294.1 hypothetical protein [Xanthomonadales bacterium]